MSAGLARWQAFLEATTARHAQILAEARAGCLALFAACDEDLGPLTSAWTAMDLRALTLEGRIEDTWSDKVEALLEDEGHPDAVVEVQGERGRTLASSLEQTREHTRIALYAEAARRIWARALAERPVEVGCSQCGALLDVPTTLVSLNLTCGACGAVNTYEPGARARQVGSAAIPALLDEATLEQADAVRRAQDALNASRDEPAHLIDDLEVAHRAYWSKRLRLQHAWEGRTLDLDKELRGRMRAFSERYRS